MLVIASVARQKAAMNDPVVRPNSLDLLVVGAGPAGLMAAEIVSAQGYRVAVVDRMPSPGRKFLMAGLGGLNITHSEPLAAFIERYGNARPFLEPAIRRFPPAAVREWAMELGEETFVGSSGRVFPRSLKASPLLRAWLRRLGSLGVTFLPNVKWDGCTYGNVHKLRTSTGRLDEVSPRATILALGGGSWGRLGSDGSWLETLETLGIGCAAFRPSNCGFGMAWSDSFRQRFAGTPLKRLRLRFAQWESQGELVVTQAGLEGGALYALSGPIRDQAALTGSASVTLDLLPDRDEAALTQRLAKQPTQQSLSNRLRKATSLPPVAINLLREVRGSDLPREPAALAALIKNLPLRLSGPIGLERAISTAGGVRWEEIDPSFMLRRLPGVFVAGEMIDWEAPTGGYLLQACMATGAAAGEGALQYLARSPENPQHAP
ncbi:hypothetical protein SAMN07250955_10492 [Arboricoccus pini]|uniref:TIGR03862 family flavoprotein n=1 Tax=Arboricoccus pini TaxID=1963835 RepID=A0A212QY73_9PROT|nr:hypothetical protein SAMN07250955_10492 [Arboricoccus pini]